LKETIESLAKAFIGESQARNRYTFYSKVAKKEGYEQIAEIFRMTADNENEHAEWLFKLMIKLKGDDMSFDDIDVPADVPTICGDTITNLKSAITGENHERTRMYPEFAGIARSEGYPEIADRLLNIAKAEGHHEERYMKLLKQLEQGQSSRRRRRSGGSAGSAATSTTAPSRLKSAPPVIIPGRTSSCCAMITE